MQVSDFMNGRLISKAMYNIQMLSYSIFINNNNQHIKDVYPKLYISSYIFFENHYMFTSVGRKTNPSNKLRHNMSYPKKYFFNCFIDLDREHNAHISATQYSPKKISSYVILGGTSNIIHDFINSRLYMKERYNLIFSDYSVRLVYKSHFNVREYILVYDDSNEMCKMYDLFKEFVYVKAKPVLTDSYTAIISNEIPAPTLGKWDSISSYTNNIVIKANKHEVIDCTSKIPFKVDDKYVLI